MNLFQFQSSVIIVVLVLVIQNHAQAAEPKFLYAKCDSTAGNYTATSSYKKNVDGVLSDLTSIADTSLYNYTSHGSGADEVFGMFYCRFDLTNIDCQQCVQTAATNILKNCTVEMTATIFYNDCVLRFANHSLDSVYEDRSGVILGDIKVNNPSQFLQVLGETFDGLVEKAVYNSSYKGRAHEVRKVNDYQKVYCFLQCRPDTTGVYCNRCLRVMLTNIAAIFSDGASSKGAVVTGVNCMGRFDTEMFLNVPSPGYSNSTPPSPLHQYSPPPPFGQVPPPPRLPSNSGGSKMIGTDERMKQLLYSTLASLLIMLLVSMDG